MTTKDVIKSSIYESLTGGTYLDVKTILGILFFAALIGIYVYLVYRFSSKNAFYSKDLNVTMAGLPVIIAAIMIAMQANLLVSFGMVGALSIVRFRTAVKNPLDLLYLFWAVSTGIICGVNLKVLSLLMSVIMTCIILILQTLPILHAPSVLVVRSSLDVDWEEVKSCIAKYTKAAKIKSESSRNGQKELIYEVRVKADNNLVGELEKLGMLQAINLLSHDGEFRG